MALTDFLNPILNPILLLEPWLAVAIISFVVALAISVIYKYVTDQTLMRELRKDMDKFRKKMKDLKDNPDKMMAEQKKAMEVQMQYMMQSMKPTLFTFIPILLLFAWLNANLAFAPIMPGDTFNVEVQMQDDVVGDVQIFVPEGLKLISEMNQTVENNRATWQLEAESQGSYELKYVFENEEQMHDVLVTDRQAYAKEIVNVKDSSFKIISTQLEKTVLFNLFGWNVSWLWGYIIFSMIFSIAIRKLLRVH